LINCREESPLEADIRRCLSDLGHLASEIDESLKYFSGKALILAVHGSIPRVRINRLATRAYQYLVTTSAYVDNVALTTPVTANVRTDIVETGTGDSDYFARKKSALAFLDDLGMIEEQYLSGMDSASAELNRAREYYAKWGIRSVFSWIKESYLLQLKEDERNRRTYKKGDLLQDYLAQWKRLMADNVLTR
jgi:hypothetical protein